MPIYQDIPKNKAKRRIIKSLDAKYHKPSELASTVPVETKIEDLLKSCESIETECEVVLSEFSMVRSEFGYNKQTFQTLYRKIRTGLQDIKGVQWTKILKEDAFKLEEYYNSLSQYIEKFNKRWGVVDENIEKSASVVNLYESRNKQVREATQKNQQEQIENKRALKQYEDAYKEIEAYISEKVNYYDELEVRRGVLQDEIDASKRNSSRRTTISFTTLEALAQEEERMYETAREISTLKRELEQLKLEINFYKSEITKLESQRKKIQTARKKLIEDEEIYQEGKEYVGVKTEDKITRKSLVDGLTEFVRKLSDGILINKSGSSTYGDYSGVYIGGTNITNRYLLGGGVFGVVEPQPKRYT